jgi:ATP-dependent helicase YprA (DUF1998 family)/very-short-patch-repair endonuclease
MEPISIAITREEIESAASLARECSSAVTRERVLVSRAVALSVRRYLGERSLETKEGRSVSPKYVDLLDICDFSVNNWSIESRAVTQVERLGLYVPTMPLMVGVLSDLYVGAQVDTSLRKLNVFGYATREGLGAAELTKNGLFAVVPVEDLQPFDELLNAVSSPKQLDPEIRRSFEEWQERASRIIRGLSDLLAAEGVFGQGHMESLGAGLRDEVVRIWGERLPATGLEPLFDQLFRRFGISKPVPKPPGDETLFANPAMDNARAQRAETQPAFFRDQLGVDERVSLYRHLLEDESALRGHRQMKRALDRATGGKHQTTIRRRSHIRTKAEARNDQGWLEAQPEADSMPGTIDLQGSDLAADLVFAELASPYDSMYDLSEVEPSQPPSRKSTSMNIFDFRDHLIRDYADYVNGFITIRDPRIREHVDDTLAGGLLWPEPLIQVNPFFESGGWIDDLTKAGVLHQECSRIFRKDKDDADLSGIGRPLRLHRHQLEAINVARGGGNYVLTTGTGSGKSLAYIIPIVDHVLKHESGKGIKAIVVYPMNALANSQQGELTKFLCLGYPDGKGPVTFAKYTGQESDEERKRIIADPPDILLTNYVMLELILTRTEDSGLIGAAQGLRFLILDELHTYRGRQGADVALLVRRVRDRLAASQLQCIGTSATIAGAGSQEQQRKEVAEVAAQLFGAEVKPENIVGETLRRATPALDFADPGPKGALTEMVSSLESKPPTDYESYRNSPLSAWIENTFGLDIEDGRLVRSKPKRIAGEGGAAERLNQLTGVSVDRCAEVIKTWLLGAYECKPDPETGSQPFAFRLHQFISRGDTVYASLEEEAARHITVYGQTFKPGSRDHILLPLVFCRECGQEYFCVRRQSDSETKKTVYVTRELRDHFADDDSEPGFLYFSTREPWPTELADQSKRLPDDWLEERNGVTKIRQARTEYVPRPVRIETDGREASDGLECSYISAPFRFCLNCRVSYGFRQRDDFAKLSALASEGRSTATTITSLSAIRRLRREPGLSPKARKLLSFTDNRQDASLQSGHFNDFVETALMRSALYRAVRDSGAEGVTHEEMTQRVFASLSLPLELYAANPQARFQALKDTERALREVLGYRLYRDLKRGWRITSPNLEQCGLLTIDYLSLDEVSAAEDIWTDCHVALAAASPFVRMTITKVLLDFMRRELAINVNYLDDRYHEQIRQLSAQRLISPWAIDENEVMGFATVLFPRARVNQDSSNFVFLSPQGGFGQYLRRPTTFGVSNQRVGTDDIRTIIGQLLTILTDAGLLAEVIERREPDDVPGYQLKASSMRWLAGEGTAAFHDPIRVPNAPESGGRTNPFFVAFYRSASEELHGVEAHEHTAQVEYDTRVKRENDFRDGRLPVLYCSPTMELGVDIAELNVVNLRNIPPTPANYAQRSGRAGRSGQPALVFSYCTTGSPHDQYFFKRPERMVQGSVTPPRLDLSNEDLVRAHVHAIWLAETGLNLQKSLKDLLDVSGENPSFELLDSVRQGIESKSARQRAHARATTVLASLAPDLEESDWYSRGWLDEVFAQIGAKFNEACERWRGLCRAALKQAQAQDQIIRDASRSAEDRKQAERLRKEAEAQFRLLTEVENLVQSDFYSYRYFASEGFLPGYNFPRLPISAFVPGRRTKQRDEFLSRPRFLAISEFGPRSFLYHEGSRYIINKVILPIPAAGEESVLTNQAKLCPACGYLHPLAGGKVFDICERCGGALDAALDKLFRLQNVSTKRRDKINSDEEERLRLGYEIISGIRFTEHGGRPSYRTAVVERDGDTLARLAYGQAATVWRINLGWTRRKNKSQHGFVLDIERGYWKRNEQLEEDSEDPMSGRTARVIPYVEDNRNCLLLEPGENLSREVMASLQAALKSAIQVQYQLEDNELAAEPLPDSNNRRLILFYESAEGGAGVLRRLLDDPDAFARVAREALRICHFDPITGEDQHKAPNSPEECEAACYDCLMNYGNQRDHRLLDRKELREHLLGYAQTHMASAPAELPRSVHLEQLLRLAGSELERAWLGFLEQHNYRLPSKAQPLVEKCSTRPDFLYEEQKVAVYIDGVHHQYPERHERDRIQTEAMEDAGYTVIRFGHNDDWEPIIARFPHIFGRRS